MEEKEKERQNRKIGIETNSPKIRTKKKEERHRPEGNKAGN